MRRLIAGLRAAGRRAVPGPAQLRWPLVFAACLGVSAGVALGLGRAAAAVQSHGHLRRGMLNLALQISAQSVRETLGWACLAALGAALLLVLLRGLLTAPSARARLDRTERARWPRALAAAALSAAILLQANVAFQRTFRSPQGPNVILVVVDTLRADHLGVYGYGGSTSPALDALASQGVVFRNAYSASSWTRPAVASIVSAKLPTEHGITSEKKTHALSPAYVTIAEYLRQRNYRTLALSSNSHLSFGLLQGFEEIRHRKDGGADELYDHSLEWIDANRGDPFFLLIHNNDPHDHYKYHRGFSATAEDAPYRTLGQLTPMKKSAGVTDVVVLDDAALGIMRENYDGEIRFLDHHLGRLIDHLWASDLLDHTVVLVTADHGEEFLEHGDYWHGRTLYDELIRVPLVIRAPGLEAAQIDVPVGTVDLFPTLVELLGGDPAELGLAGRSLLPLMAGAPALPRPILSASAFRGPLVYSVILGDHKLIRRADGELVGLFDLRLDPGERRDLSEVDPERLSKMEGLLASILDAMPDVAAEPPAQVELDDEVRDELESLGYLVE